MTGKTEGAQSVARAALLLRAISSFGASGASLMQISEATDIPKTTVHRMLAAMGDAHLVERPQGTRRYRLGSDIFAFGWAVRGSFDLKTLCRPSLERLAKETGTTVYLSVRSGYDMLCIDQADHSPADLALVMQVGDRWPLGIGSASLAMLAFMAPDEIADAVAYNERRVREEDTLTFQHIGRSMEKTRHQGFAMRAMHTHQGLAGVAVPVFDHRRYPVASICAVAPASKMDDGYVQDVARLLTREAELIGRFRGMQRSEPSPESWRKVVRSLPVIRAP